MAAGLGFKEFTTGDVLTAADANGYLASQVVMVFADAAARTAAITSPQEGMISFLKDTNATQYYSGSAWVDIAPAAAGGKVLQVVSVQKLDTFSSTAASPTAITGLSATITPSAASSNVYVILTMGRVDSSAANNVAFRLKRGATVVGGGTAVSNRLSSWISFGPGGANQGSALAASYLDSPATTSATTYSIEGWNDTAARTFYVNRSNNDPDNAEAGGSRTSSTITLLEIGA